MALDETLNKALLKTVRMLIAGVMILGLIGINACKDVDISSLNIQFLSPVANSLITPNTTLKIRVLFRVSKAGGSAENILFGVENVSGMDLGAVITTGYQVMGDTVELNIPLDQYALGGELAIFIKARGEYKGEVELAYLRLLLMPEVEENGFVYVQQDVNSFELILHNLDSSRGLFTTSGQWAGGLANALHHRLWYFVDGQLYSYDLSKDQHYGPFSISGTITAMQKADDYFLVGTDRGRIRKYSYTGTLMAQMNLSGDFENISVGGMYITGADLYVQGIHRITGENLLYQIKISTGVVQRSFSFEGTLTGVYPKSEDRVFVFRSGVGVDHILEMNTTNGGLYTVHTSEGIVQSEQVALEHFVLVSENRQLLNYTYQNNSLVALGEEGETDLLSYLEEQELLISGDASHLLLWDVAYLDVLDSISVSNVVRVIAY